MTVESARQWPVRDPRKRHKSQRCPVSPRRPLHNIETLEGFGDGAQRPLAQYSEQLQPFNAWRHRRPAGSLLRIGVEPRWCIYASHTVAQLDASPRCCCRPPARSRLWACRAAVGVIYEIDESALDHCHVRGPVAVRATHRPTAAQGYVGCRMRCAPTPSALCAATTSSEVIVTWRIRLAQIR